MIPFAVSGWEFAQGKLQIANCKLALMLKPDNKLFGFDTFIYIKSIASY